MTDTISDNMLEYITVLAQLETEPSEKAQLKMELARMLEYMAQLQEVDTDGTVPMQQVNEEGNAFREDVVTNTDMRAQILANAPAVKDGTFVVPATF
ncbi:MAG: Asp-tRNA(Asn)/Glu-tRNA(Gln) amidotransferase subunit GatC [Lachnospiraceae bacterium]|nr:Asp-tRNA(Asn)/Glu-tRNA(Gln) amidotransferase subunit GatC [Lachnospiraceae bacterium]